MRIKWLIASRVGRFLRFITLFNLDTVEFPPSRGYFQFSLAGATLDSFLS